MSSESSPSIIGRASERLRTASGRNEIITPDPMVLVGGMSRSGTTLLATVLDSHPEIACGAELLPAELPPPAELLCLLDRAMELAEGEFANAGRALRQDGDRPTGLFFTRCHRAGVAEGEVRDALRELAAEMPGAAMTLGERLKVACRIVRKRALREGAALYGFKYASASLGVALAYLPDAYFVGIIRDPLDVVLSHQKRGFEKTVAEVCASWNAYARKYRTFCEERPERAMTIRYEDLVRAPRRTLGQVFEMLPVSLHQRIFAFYESDSPIHAGAHPNAERLRMNFSTSGVGRGREVLPVDIAQEIDAACRVEMRHLGYDHRGWVKRVRAQSEDRVRISKAERFIQRQKFASKRKFSAADYEALLAPYMETHEIMPIGEYVREAEVGDRKILMIRHDVDHDPETAVKIAEWEAARGLRATYCLLHTSWYYGRLEDGRYRHSDLLLETVERLCELGHEINFHNNLVALTLREGIDPVALLERELAFFHRLGVPISGTSTHGDALCRELGFRNWELFQECCDGRFGGPRTVSYRSGQAEVQLRLGEISMFDYGLEYEAYDIAKDYYHTESGGIMRLRESTFGRRPFGRASQDKGSVCGVLTHPIWWEF
ncbi:sulfotransferase family protein [Halochromatium glycolicum]|nr:sulfotransferase [Halochromatium glycolicum]